MSSFINEAPQLGQLQILFQNSTQKFKNWNGTYQNARRVFKASVPWPLSNVRAVALVHTRASQIGNLMKADAVLGPNTVMQEISRAHVLLQQFMQARFNRLREKDAKRKAAQDKLKRNAKQSKQAQISTGGRSAEQVKKKLRDERNRLIAEVERLKAEIRDTKFAGVFSTLDLGSDLQIRRRDTLARARVGKTLGERLRLGGLLGMKAPPSPPRRPRVPSDDKPDLSGGITGSDVVIPTTEPIVIPPLDPVKVEEAGKKRKQKIYTIAGISAGGAALAATILIKVL